MFLPDCRLLLSDEEGHILLLDCASGHLLSRWSLPHSHIPLGLFEGESAERFYIPAKTSSNGALFALDLAAPHLTCLTSDLPHMTAAAMQEKRFAFADENGSLTLLTLPSLTLRPLGHTADALCSALALTDDRLYSAWSAKDGGILACHDANGAHQGEWQFEGEPTALFAEEKRLRLTYTNSKTCGEGVLFFDFTDRAAPKRTRITLQTPTAMKGAPLYPCDILETQDTIYIVNESAACLTKLDARTHAVTGSITLGHSVSRLFLLPDVRFALAVGNLFGDLVCLDLINERILSIANAPHGFLPYAAILPAAR